MRPNQPPKANPTVPMIGRTWRASASGLGLHIVKDAQTAALDRV